MRISLYATAVLVLLLSTYLGSYLLVSDYLPAAGGGARTFRSLLAAQVYDPLLAAESAIRGVSIDAYVHQ